MPYPFKKWTPAEKDREQERLLAILSSNGIHYTRNEMLAMDIYDFKLMTDEVKKFGEK